MINSTYKHKTNGRLAILINIIADIGSHQQFYVVEYLDDHKYENFTANWFRHFWEWVA